MRALVASLAAIAVVAGLRLASESPEGVPLIQLPQGVSGPRTFDEHRVFVRRVGSAQVSGFLARSPVEGAPLWWCPLSQVFLEPRRATMWDADGRYVVGPEQRDLTTVPLEVDPVRLTVGAREPVPARGRGDGTVPGEVKAAYDNWAAGRNELEVGFCRDALR